MSELDTVNLSNIPDKLTNWENEPSIINLKKELEDARIVQRTHITNVNRWNDILKVRGKQKPPAIKGRSSVQPKLARIQAEWRYSALSEPFLSHNKIFKITPVTFEDEAAAKQNELLLNYQFRTKINRVDFIDQYIRNLVDDGTAIVRLGWTRETEQVTETVPVFEHYEITTPEEMERLEAAINLYQSDRRTYNETVPEDVKSSVDLYLEQGIPTVAVPVGEEEIQVEKIIENKPTLELMNLANVYIDPTCNGDFDKALFVICSFETNRAELDKYPERYKNLDLIDWENIATVEPDHETETPDTFSFADKARRKAVAYEYWGYYDIHGTGLKPIVATWVDNVLIRMEESPFPDGKLPFVKVVYNPVKRSVYGEPDAELIEDNQRILGAISRGMIDLLGKSANGQQGFAKGMLDVLNRRRFDNGQDYEFNPSIPIQNGLIEHKYPEIPQSAITMLNLQYQQAESLTGVKAFTGGISGSAYGDVATGIRGALDAASKREMAIIRRAAEGIKNIGSKLISMNAVWLSEEEVIRVTNREYVTILREDLKGNFDLEVDISTAEVDDAKAQDLGFMLQTLGPNLGLQFTTMILAEIAELKRMPALAEQIRTYQPQPDPIEQERKVLELEKLRMEVEEMRSKAKLNEANAAKAQSDADLNNLEFVEEETGTKHARELEKHKAQSEGNQNLEVTKALLKSRKEGETRPDIEAGIGFNQLSNAMNNPVSPLERDQLAPTNPNLNLRSGQFDPSIDPAMNPNLNI